VQIGACFFPLTTYLHSFYFSQIYVIIMMFDAHLHLADESALLDIRMVKEIIKEAEKEGISYFLSNSLDKRTIDENIALAKEFPEVFLGLGFFPTEFKKDQDLHKIEYLKEKIREAKKEGLSDRLFIGEVGLDFKEKDANKEVQEKALINILKIAKEENLYVEIHSRFAVKQVVNILEDFQYKKVIMHWFTDSKKYIDKVAKLGYFITIGPKYLYDQNIFENIKDVPKEQILFETDYPANVSGKAHKPEIIKEIFNKYCKDKEINKDEMHTILKESFRKIFPNIKA